MNLPKHPPQQFESKWTERWKKAHAFSVRGSGKGYCVMMPPPNVTGSLHMGHAFQQSLMDILVRRKRQEGFDAHLQGGTDHAGIATQMMVEVLLKREGTSRTALGREKFLERVWAWKTEFARRGG